MTVTNVKKSANTFIIQYLKWHYAQMRITEKLKFKTSVYFVTSVHKNDIKYFFNKSVA